VHLLCALFIIAGLVWTALDLRALAHDPRSKPARLRPLVLLSGGLLFVQLLFGAFTAGLNAGYVSSTWPLMNDHIVPEGIDWTKSRWAVVSGDPYLVHFIHRWWAWIAALGLVMLARAAKQAGNRRAANAIHAMLVVQIALGIVTVMSGIALWIAVLHQAVGALVVAATSWSAHAIGRRRI